MSTEAIEQPSRRTESDAARWSALAARDASADGTFVYSVRTTGVYCRPSGKRRIVPLHHA